MRSAPAGDPPRPALAWLALLALHLAVRVPLLAVPLERDEGLYASVGDAIRHGAIPYRDVFEHKPPLAFAPYVLATTLAPHTATGLHVALLGWNLATAVVLALLARVLAGDAAAAWTFFCFTVASAAPSLQGCSLTIEMTILLPLTASVLLGWLGLERRRAPWLAASGALAGVAFWMKQPGVVSAGVTPLLVAWQARQSPRWGATGLAAWIGGLAVLSAVVVGPFVVAGLGGEFWYWSFTHSWLYGQLPVPTWPGRLAGHLTALAGDLGPMLVLGGLGVARLAPHRRALVVVWLIVSIASALHSKFFYLHYFALVAASVGLWGGVGVAALVDVARRRAGATAARFAAAAAALIIVAVPVGVAPWYWWRPDPTAVIRRLLGAQGFEAAPLVADYVRARTTPDETVLVWGSEPEIPFLAGRRNANPFGMVYPVTWPWPRHREFQQWLWDRIEATPPRYLVVARSPFSFVASPAADPWLATQLEELGRRDYDVEAFAVSHADGTVELTGTPPSSPDAGTSLFEIWRRR